MTLVNPEKTVLKFWPLGTQTSLHGVPQRMREKVTDWNTKKAKCDNIYRTVFYRWQRMENHVCLGFVELGEVVMTWDMAVPSFICKFGGILNLLQIFNKFDSLFSLWFRFKHVCDSWSTHRLLTDSAVVAVVPPESNVAVGICTCGPVWSLSSPSPFRGWLILEYMLSLNCGMW